MGFFLLLNSIYYYTILLVRVFYPRFIYLELHTHNASGPITYKFFIQDLQILDYIYTHTMQVGPLLRYLESYPLEMNQHHHLVCGLQSYSALLIAWREFA